MADGDHPLLSASEASSLPAGGQRLSVLPWDSQHFGFPVAQLLPGSLDEHALGVLLALAQEQGIHLVYWSPEPERLAPAGLLREFSGRLVDWKVVYEAEVKAVRTRRMEASSAGVVVREYPQGPASDGLLALGIAAGVHSRYRMDPGITPDATARLFAIWTERSARRELADMVLVAEAQCCAKEPLGMVTVRQRGEVGSIGLAAVQQVARGKGVGKALLAAAHAWMAGRSIVRAEVVTQRANLAACALYERCGYSVRSANPFYHFWPQERRHP
jgi:dTDP-4-amino-4,6-dideoxy-D-galactose acyltransferase